MTGTSAVYEPKLLNRWKLPPYYLGAEWPAYYIFLARNRESDVLTVSNFFSGLKRIGGESETVVVVSENHWACGWVEWIAIHESDAETLQRADDVLNKLNDYPVVDEDDWSHREFEAVGEYWESESLPARIKLCVENGYSFLAARHASPPERVFDSLRDLV